MSLRTSKSIRQTLSISETVKRRKVGRHALGSRTFDGPLKAGSLPRLSDREVQATTGTPTLHGPTRSVAALAKPAWKRRMDVVGATLLLAATLPLMVLLSVAIMLDSRGGPFFRQTRVGHGGRIFVCWKFRSMRRGADGMRAAMTNSNEASGPIFKMRDDPRRTRVGKLLRRSSLDELPQLWNVLCGDMSLVGPRPPTVAEVAEYDFDQLQRLAAPPGMTGLWQVTLRGRHDFEDMVRLDVEYARNMSLGQDLRILLKTVPTVLLGHGSY